MPPHIDTEQYNYPLPEERIAKYPVAERDASRLLVYDRGNISDHVFRELPELLTPGARLVCNDTRVIHARLVFHKPTGARIEVFCLQPTLPADTERAFAATQSCQWQCIVGNSKKWHEGTLTHPVSLDGQGVTLRAERLSTEGETSQVRFAWDGGHSFAAVLEAAGQLPIPPYLNRPTEDVDQTRYQTVYSHYDGSVAAPTAGLHFTQRTFDELRRLEHPISRVTLHVGAGTFKPMQATDAAQHTMHAEHISVTAATLDELLDAPRPITAVGTTSVRTLESLHWLGVKALLGCDPRQGLAQWDPYNLPSVHTTPEALAALRMWLRQESLERLECETRIMIVPGYHFRLVNELVTNFHQPHSTLLLLVAALIGPDWRPLYDHALQAGYRFLSYGDASLLRPRG